MRYTEQLKTWAERRAAIVRHFEQTQSYGDTARAFGISRERVRQIISEEKARAPKA